MPLITLFSAPKSFADPEIARSQENAIGSWTRLPDVEVLLLGQEPGLGEAARRLGAQYEPGVARNPNGVPLISSMFEMARRAGDSPLLAVVNADIILLPDFVQAARTLAAGRSAALAKGFVLVSRRWDLELTAALDFTGAWEPRLRQSVQDQATLHRPAGSDLFVFPRRCYPEVPDFTIGRAGWDNWMIYKARNEGWAVVDGTASMLVVHQNHDYRHLPGARPHYDHPETHLNTQLAGGPAAVRYTILDATHALAGGRLRRPGPSWARFLRGVELFIRRVFSFLPEATLENIARPRRWARRIKRLFGKAA